MAVVLKLRILAGPPGDEPSPRAERTVEVAEHLAEIRLGRRAGLEIELPFPALSRLHARLYRDGARWMIEDLNSALGTWLDGVSLPPGQPRAIETGATLRLAHVGLVFEGPAPSASAAGGAPEGTATIARRLVSDLLGAGGGPRRREREGKDGGGGDDDDDGGQVPRLIGLVSGPWQPGLPPTLRLTVPDRPYLVGRDPTCDLILPSDEISREHAVLVRRWEGVHLRDLDSKNGVSVAGEPLAGRERRLRDGDQVTMGSIAFTLDDPEDRYLRQLESAPDPPSPTKPGSRLSPPSPSPPSPSPPSLKKPVGVAPPALGWRALNLPVIVAASVLVAIAAVALILIVS